MKIKRITSLVEIDVAGDGEYVTVHEGHGRWWSMRVRDLLVEYVWDARVDYWRVAQSTVWGTPIAGACPDEYTYERQDRQKPLWLVALEQVHYPKRGSWNTSMHEGL